MCYDGDDDDDDDYNDNNDDDDGDNDDDDDDLDDIDDLDDLDDVVDGDEDLDILIPCWADIIAMQGLLPPLGWQLIYWLDVSSYRILPHLTHLFQFMNCIPNEQPYMIPDDKWEYKMIYGDT